MRIQNAIKSHSLSINITLQIAFEAAGVLAASLYILGIDSLFLALSLFSQTSSKGIFSYPERIKQEKRKELSLSIKSKFIVALDQGTTSSRAIIFDHNTKIIAISQRELSQIYPRPSWVEHDPIEIYNTQHSALQDVIKKSGISPENIAAIGIANQRETTIVWNKHTGKPIYNAIVWQCRRTADICEQLKKEGHQESIKEKTGLVIDPYFSGTKIKWILDNVKGAKEQAENGHLLFGTVETWLIWKMTQGHVHITDFTNASRTMLFNINTRQWDKTLLDILKIPLSMLPKVKASSGVHGEIKIDNNSKLRTPIAGIVGDQQAALFGQTCVEPGQTKNTYGTGCFLLMNTGKKKVSSKNNLLTTLACDRHGDWAFALEGSVFMGGASVQWLRDEMRLIRHAKDSEYYATQVKSSEGIYVVPAFSGLGAPYWDPYARGTILGLTRSINANHIIRATLESIAYQSLDVIKAMEADSGIKLPLLKVDGGAVSNNFLMQFQSDIINTQVQRLKITELTALGAASLAGLAIGFWKDIDEIENKIHIERVFLPCIDDGKRERRYQGWLRAIERAKGWELY